MLKINSKIKCINCHNIPSDEKIWFFTIIKEKYQMLINSKMDIIYQKKANLPLNISKWLTMKITLLYY
jgi:hypothetical protein